VTHISLLLPFTDLEDESAKHRLKYDEERKYGTIPARIYLLYLKACGIPTLVVFFTSTFMWQGLRIYTDVWLRDWTDSDDDAADVCCKINARFSGFWCEVLKAFDGGKFRGRNFDKSFRESNRKI
jgi:hypothetical protein